MNDSGGRWWEVRGDAQPDQSGYSELGTDSRGRTRPERSLSAGADLADEPRHPARAFLWPVVSVVAAVALILSVSYVVSVTKRTSSDSALPPEPAARGDAGPAAGVKQDAGVIPSAPPAQLANLPAAVGGEPQPTGRPAGIPRGPTDSAQTRPAAPVPNNPTPAPNSSPDDTAKDTGDRSTWTPNVSTPASPPAATLKLDGPTPPAPVPQQPGQPARGRGGDCRIDNNTSRYTCIVKETAPLYRPETTDQDPRGPLPSGRYPFLCQSDGSTYSAGNRTNHWWAWIGSSDDGAWLPVGYLAGGRNDAPAGLPICGSPGSVTSAPTPSNPPTEPVEITMVDHKTGRCLDSNYEGEVQTVGCNGSDEQKWEAPGDGTIRDKQTKRCLDSNEAGNVYTLDCNDGDYQKWYPQNGDTIRDEKTGFCLDSNEEGKVYSMECNDGDYQKWIVK